MSSEANGLDEQIADVTKYGGYLAYYVCNSISVMQKSKRKQWLESMHIKMINGLDSKTLIQFATKPHLFLIENAL